MPQYNEVYISQQEFERSLHEKKPYNGFVEELGYAYTFNFSIPPVHLQKHNPPGRVSDEDSFFKNGFFQHIDSSPEMRLMSVKYSHKVKSGDTLTSISQLYGITIQSIKDANSGINWTGERKGDRILAGEELKLPKGEEKKLADNSQSEGVCSQNPLIGPTIARANFEQRLCEKLYGGDSAANGGGNQLDPSTVGRNLPLIGGRSSYAGGNNPTTYSGKYTYSYIPTTITDYPAIGHDRRYDNLQIEGASGLYFDSRAIGADWRFVREQFQIYSRIPDPVDKANALLLGIGLGVCALPKTIYQMAKSNGFAEMIMWDQISNAGVTNKPGN